MQRAQQKTNQQAYDADKNIPFDEIERYARQNQVESALVDAIDYVNDVMKPVRFAAARDLARSAASAAVEYLSGRTKR
jgi:hypothetical protein